MSVDIIQHAFVAGELSPRLFGRTDLEKNDFGLARAQNFFIDYRGGASTRPGTEFIDFVKEDDKATRFIEFQFAPTTANTYVLLFGENYVRFLQDGAYVLEADVSISGITQADPGVVSATAHGFSNGDWVKASGIVGMTELNGRTLVVSNVTTNTFELQDVFGNDLDTTNYAAYVSGGTLNRIYTLASPYSAADLSSIRTYQRFDLLRITHPDHPIRNLVRTSATSWAFSLETLENDQASPSNVTLTPSSGGSAGVGVQVTAVDRDTGIESLPSRMKFHTASVNYTSTAGSLLITWDAVDNASEYKIYRTQVLPTGTQITYGAEVGYIGRAFGTQFTDNNIVPDFTATPPRNRNPFANGAITHVDITAKGSGYSRDDTISISTSTGSGFVGYPIVNNSGEILAVIIENEGADYDAADTVSFTTSGGSGATATITVNEADGNNPHLSSIFQQRQLYAATDNEPLTIKGSKPGQLSNFGDSLVTNDSDAFDFDLDSDEVTPLRHMIPTRGGVLVMSQKGIWQLSGGGPNSNDPITPTNALADPQSYTGAALIEPLLINNNLLYIEGKGTTVRLLEYQDNSRAYTGRDMSVLSTHFFTTTTQVTRWGFASEPFKLVHAVRSDGALLTFTVVEEQNVFAWTVNYTQGYYRDVLVVQEDTLDSVYYMTERYINGRWTKFIERVKQRNFTHVEDAWCVDCGLQLGETTPAANLTVSALSGSGVTVTASASVFASGDVGKIIRMLGGKAVVTAYTSGTEITITWLRDGTEKIPETETPATAASGDWTMDTLVTSIGGLWHLEGQTLAVLADGNVIPNLTVTNGTITLPEGATRVIAGLGYTCILQTLPNSVTEAIIENKLQRVVGIAARLAETRGLKLGEKLTSLYDMKERTFEAYAEPTELTTGARYDFAKADFNRDGQIFLVQEFPLPATILGLVLDVDTGDDND